jgi:hypothetical protein
MFSYFMEDEFFCQDINMQKMSGFLEEPVSETLRLNKLVFA